MTFRILIIAIIGLLFGCNRDGNSSNISVGEKYADFEEFYERFHEDSLYQMEHIVFPLQGLPPEANSTTIANGFSWKKENWRMHRGFELEGSDFERSFIPVGEEILVEQIIHKNNQMGMMRRFAKMQGEWNLIYYVALNGISKTEDLQIDGGF